MTTIATLLLALLATDVSRARTLTVPRSIDRTVARLAVGLAATYGDEARLPDVAKLLEGNLEPATIRHARLYVDGQRAGHPLRRVLHGVATLGLFILDRSDPGDSVELRYTLLYRGLAIERATLVQEGQIVSIASFACRLGPQGRVRHVWLAVRAYETDAGTTIRLAATTRVNTGLCAARGQSRCRLVNRVATKMISKQLDSTFLQVEREGRSISATGRDTLLRLTRHLVDGITRWAR